MTQLILHIGDPKTGTSSIQTALYESRLTCPTLRLVSPPELSEAKLAATLFEPARRKERGAQLRKKAKWLAGVDADFAVVSAEQFSHVKPEVMHNVLTNQLTEYADTARVVAYVRPHAQRTLSAYAQQTKCGMSIRPQTKFHAHALAKAHFVYSDRFEGWRDAFGDRFVLRPMIRKCLRDGDVTRDFFNVVLQGADFDLDTPDTVNESLNLKQLACVREIQIVLRAQKVNNRVRVGVGSYFGMILNARTPTTPGEKVRMHRDLAETIARDYAEDATRMDRLFFDAPLMLEALNEAVETAVAQAQPHALEHYASPTQLASVQASAATLAEALHLDGVGWKNTRLKSIGQSPRKMPETIEELESVARVQALLDDLTGQIETICI